METGGPRLGLAGHGVGEGCGGGQRKRLGRRAEACGPRAAVRTLAASLAGRVLSQGDLLFEHHSVACRFVVGGGGEVPGTLRDPHGMAPSMSVLDGSFWLLCLAPPSPTPACRAGPACCLFVRPGLGPEAAAARLSRARSWGVSQGKGGVLGWRGWPPKWGAHLCASSTPRAFALAQAKQNWKPRGSLVCVGLAAHICPDLL